MLIVLGILIFGAVMVVFGVSAVKIYDDAILRDQHPPDPDPRHRQWPQDGDWP